MTVSPLVIINSIADRLRLISVANGYKTDLGSNVLINERSFSFEDDIDRDTVNVCDDGIAWESENNYFYRHQNFTLQFYVVASNIVFIDKVYEVYEDIEKFLLEIVKNVLSPEARVKIRNPKGSLKFHSDGREIALIEIDVTTTVIVK